MRPILFFSVKSSTKKSSWNRCWSHNRFFASFRINSVGSGFTNLSRLLLERCVRAEQEKKSRGRKERSWGCWSSRCALSTMDRYPRVRAAEEDAEIRSSCKKQARRQRERRQERGVRELLQRRRRKKKKKKKKRRRMQLLAAEKGGKLHSLPLTTASTAPNNLTNPPLIISDTLPAPSILFLPPPHVTTRLEARVGLSDTGRALDRQLPAPAPPPPSFCVGNLQQRQTPFSWRENGRREGDITEESERERGEYGRGGSWSECRRKEGGKAQGRGEVGGGCSRPASIFAITPRPRRLCGGGGEGVSGHRLPVVRGFQERQAARPALSTRRARSLQPSVLLFLTEFSKHIWSEDKRGWRDSAKRQRGERGANGEGCGEAEDEDLGPSIITAPRELCQLPQTQANPTFPDL
ncbi:unnamed protein product [Pleuronectes platessa]|uniref:Uncharacterized protein n=1 Tax=Pleuronectes platessa TaxID=8262 RepID=A0A9N7UNU5_PLEPL|nr:unnamed protein product [Pleuronectes platessa]